MITKLFKKPCVISIIGDVNSGKSNFLYYVIAKLKLKSKFKLYTYGLKSRLANATEIYSISELERIRDSIIILDEVMTLFDLDNRKIKKQIENTLRLINHNNNILVLCGVPENFKKFLSGKVDYIMYKRVTFEDFINGSRVKNVVMNFRGIERGTTLLDLKTNEVLIFDGLHYTKQNVPYIRQYDSKKNNVNILVPKSVRKIVQKKKSTKLIIDKPKETLGSFFG